MKRIAIATMLIGMSTWLQAAGTISLGIPSYNGTGCPSGSVSATLSPDKSSLSVLFDNFTARVGGTTGKKYVVKSCNMALNVKVPAGMSVSVYQQDYRGFNNLESGTASTILSEFFFAGKKGPTLQKNYYGSLSNDFSLTKTSNSNSYSSKCGQSVILRINTSLYASTKTSAEAEISLDSIDSNARLTYYLDYKLCN